MRSLKTALAKAGFETEEQNKVIERRPSKQPVSKEEEAHNIKAQCENCGKFSPDVERYEHKNKLVDGNWLCMRCADDNNIDDKFRLTAQSTYSKTGLFIRQYGKTVRVE